MESDLHVHQPEIVPQEDFQLAGYPGPGFERGKDTLSQHHRRRVSSLQAYVGWRKILPKSYFVEVAKQKVAFDRRSSVDATQQLTQGQVLVAITNPFRIMQTAEQTGLDLAAHFPKEGVLLVGQPYGILAKAPHPNAAKLFIDFLYSEEGMKMYVDLEGIIAIRDGMKVPDKIKKYSPPLGEITAIPIRLVVLQGITGAPAASHFATLTQGLPQPVRVNPDVAHADDSRTFGERSPIVCQVRMVNEYPLVPDFERIEQMVAEETRA